MVYMNVKLFLSIKLYVYKISPPLLSPMTSFKLLDAINKSYQINHVKQQEAYAIRAKQGRPHFNV